MFGVLRVSDRTLSIKCPYGVDFISCTFYNSITYRQCKFDFSEDAIAQSGVPTSKNSLEMENHVYLKAKSKVSQKHFPALTVINFDCYPTFL